MAFTRFKYDDCRTKKQLQQSTDPGRWVLNVPGNGDKPCYIEDPQIIIQKWGSNLRTNSTNLESELLGVSRQLSRDCIDNVYTNSKVVSNAIEYPSCSKLTTGQSRTVMPAWTVRDLEQSNFSYLPLNPQENVCFPFMSNLNTRIIEKDAYDNNCNYRQ